MADEVASLLVRITADGSQAVGVLNGIQATVGTLASSNATLMNKIAAGGALASKVGTTITKTVGVATVAGLVASAKAAGQLNKELANIGTLHVPNERLKEYKGKIQDIAIATAKSTSDISEGTYQVVSAFGDAADTMEKVEINAKAARAGLSTTADSINLTSAVTKAYGDTSAAAVQHVADLAFKTVELGQTTFPELAQSMQQVTSLSKELGVSQEELFASYATLTGVTGGAAEVQTQMKAIYTALLKPSKNMAAAIHNQGFESGYAMIKTLGFAGTLDALKKATDGSEESMLGLFNNVRAMPAIMALTGAQYDTFNTKLEKMKNASGSATEAFKVQTEGVAKTGFTLEQAKEKMEVAAQRFGESAAPIIADFAGVVDSASSALANMSDEQRKNIINAGVLTTKIGLGLAVGGKLVTVGTKIAGTAKTIGSALAAVGPVGWAVAGSIAAIGTVAVAGKAAYDNWYNSQYRWSEGLSEGNEKVKESLDKYKQLSSLRKELNDNQWIINNGESSVEDVEKAKARIEEIKALLSEEYNLVIKADNSNLDETLQKVEQISANELQTNINNQMAKLRDLQPKAAEYTQRKDALEAENAAALEAWTNYDNLLTKLNGLDKSSADYGQKVRQLGVEYGIIEEHQKNLVDLSTITTNAQLKYNEALSKIKYSKEALDNLKGSYEEFIAVSESAANKQVELINIAALNGDAQKVSYALKNMAELINVAGLDMSGYAQAAALAMNGVENLETAWEQAANGDGRALNGIVNDYIVAMKSFGASTDEAVKGAALLKEGFRDASEVGTESVPAVIKSIRELGNAQGLDMTAEKLTQMAQSMGLLPENKSVKITAEGNIEIIEKTYEEITKIDGQDVSIGINVNGETQQLDLTAEQVQKLQGMGAVSIAVDANGNVELLNEAGNKIGELQQFGDVHIAVDANGNVTLLDQADAKVQELLSSGQISLQLNANGNIDILDQAQQKIGEIQRTPDVEVGVGVKPKVEGNSFMDMLGDILFPGAASASAAETEIPVDVKATPGNVNMDDVNTAIEQAASGGGTGGEGGGGGNNVDKTVDITVKAGNINTDELNTAIEQAVSGGGEGGGSAEKTVDVKINYTTGEIQQPENLTAEGTVNYIAGDITPPENVTAEGTVNYTGDFSNIGEVPPANGTANFGLGQSPTGVPDASGVANFTLGSYPTEIPPITATVNVVYQHEATGTQNFGGGLAMVNDQKGVSDPRELIVDKGRAFIPEGRDVILPLSKGAKVYTAAETKRILAGAGIPHYAGGKNNHYGYDITDDDLRREYEHLQNQLIARLRSQGYPKEMAEDTARAAWGSALEGVGGSRGSTSTGGTSNSSGGKKENSDAFKSAKDDWTHYTKTHAVTTEEELAKWVELSEQFKDNEKDIWDIEEEIYSLSVKLTKEMNDASKEYLEDRMFLNDWDEVGDSAIDAVKRVKERNLKEVEEQRMTWSEYASFMKSLGADVTDDMINQGIKRLEHEKKYNGLSEESYSEGIAEISAQLDEFYEQDLISYRQYIERKIEIGEKEFYAEREKLDKMLGVSNNYADERSYFNNWNETDDNPIDAFIRVRDRELEAIGNGRTEEEALKNISDYGSKLFQGRLEQSRSWLSEQSKYYDLSNEDYIAGLKRMLDYSNEYLDNGMIGAVEYHKAVTEINHEIWDKQEEILTEGLQKQREEIDKIKQQFQDEEQALRDSWEVDDRRESIEDLTEKVRLWQGAVTERGQEQLKQYQEQLKQAQREEQLYQLEVKNNAVIEDMEKQYKLAEDNKKVLLRGIRSQMVDAQAAVNTLVDSVENNNSNLETLLGRIEKAIYSIETGNTTNYNDNRKQTTVNHNSNYGIGEIASGRWLSGQ